MRVLILSCTLLFLLGCDAIKSSGEYRLIGKWGNSEDKGVTFWGYDELFDDGTMHSWGVIPQTDISYDIKGVYTSPDSIPGMACFEITDSSHPSLTPVNTKWCNEILEITKDVHIFKGESGEVTTLYRQ
jgi:hypothetical protein